MRDIEQEDIMEDKRRQAISSSNVPMHDLELFNILEAKSLHSIASRNVEMGDIPPNNINIIAEEWDHLCACSDKQTNDETVPEGWKELEEESLAAHPSVESPHHIVHPVCDCEPSYNNKIMR